jgi:hypothetical protein
VLLPINTNKLIRGLSLPITQKLLPRRENLLYLAESAVLTRLAIAGVRTWQNNPRKNTNPEQTQLEKYNALWERCFVEIFGTLGYMFTMHLGQDIMAKFLERSAALNPKNLKEQLKKLLEDTQKASASAATSTLDKASKSNPHNLIRISAVNSALDKVYGDSHHNLISRVLYDRATPANFWKELNQPNLMTDPAIRKAIDTYTARLNRAGSLTLIAGIGAAVLFGGVIIQWLNDRVIGPLVEPFLGQLFGLVDNRTYVVSASSGDSPFNVPGLKPKPRVTNLSEMSRTFRC